MEDSEEHELGSLHLSLEVAGGSSFGQFYTLTRFPTCSAGSRLLKRSLGFRIVFVICSLRLTARITMHIHLVSRSRPLKRSTACPLRWKVWEIVNHYPCYRRPRPSLYKPASPKFSPKLVDKNKPLTDCKPWQSNCVPSTKSVFRLVFSLSKSLVTSVGRFWDFQLALGNAMIF